MTHNTEDLVNAAFKKAAAKQPEPRPALEWIDMENWDAESRPKRRWHVLDRIPLCQPTLLSGEGSIGKSLLILHLLASTALGRDWLGFLPEPGPSWYLGSGSTSMCPMRT